jgi:hypothetical protein
MKNFILYLLPILVFSCTEEPAVNDVILPRNLQTTVAIDAGLVEVNTTADAANFYTVTFYDANDSTTVEAENGFADYIYAVSGTYAVKTKAHTDYNNYIEKVDSVTIDLDPVISNGYTTPMTYPGYTLVWHDEFSGTALSSDWVHEIGTGCPSLCGWGNNELQYYREENTSVEGGLLTITAREQNFGGSSYTSSRIKTQGLQSFKYGRIDIRAKLPFGQGIWPALWMLGDNINAVGWPSCGEIDIMEMVGGAGDGTVHGTIHWDDNGSYANFGGSNSLSSGKLSDEFHVYSIIWDETSIKWLRDDIQYHVVSTTPGGMTEFHQNFFFIFNVAVGGNWPGSPDASTVFPQTMVVDYVRVFQ